MLNTISSQADALESLTSKLKLLGMYREIDGLISELELVVSDYAREKDIYHKQKVQLERGWLTEDILPPHYLDNLLLQIRNKGQNTLYLEWYYQHLTIVPMWEHNN